ncbi:MAG: hypothetical protein HOI43_07820, partial [Gammaproteobacteria bacterium]|nr:hypothetical protein [Gammaproteobacteria bacterium]
HSAHGIPSSAITAPKKTNTILFGDELTYLPEPVDLERENDGASLMKIGATAD